MAGVLEGIGDAGWVVSTMTFSVNVAVHCFF